MKKGLALKLISAFALLSLLPLLFTGIIAVYGLRLSHERDVATMEQGLLRQKQEEIQKFFSDVVGIFELRVGYDGYSVISEPDQKFLLEKLLQENKYIIEVSFIDMNGTETSKLSRQQNAVLMGLNNVQKLPKFKSIRADTRYFGEVYQTQDGPMTTVSAPVLNKSGEMIMVLSGEISLSPLKSQLLSATLGNAGYTYIVDRSETIIAGGQNIPVGSKISEFPIVKKSFDNVNYFTLENRPGILSSDVLTMTAPVKNVNWKLIVEWPTNDANSTINELKQQFLIFSAAVLVLVLIIGGVVGSSILVPLAKLSAGAEKFGKNELDYRINVETGDEIEHLGNVMNKMADDLKKQMKEIEEAHKKIEAGLMEINKLKDDFIFVAAHELRSPVTVLQGYIAEILEDTKTLQMLAEKNPYFVDMVKGIEVSKNRLSALVDDLLNIARMEAGKFKITIKENVDLNESVKPLVESMKELCKPRKITLSFETKGKIPPLKFDPDRANELLTNLISNAVKYNKDNGKIFVTAEFKDGMIEFGVRDTGIGLDEEEQKHLFEKFWRSEEVSKLQGTGLGLFIVKHMIEQMGGKISFTSKKGEGTSFVFSLPAA